MVEHGANCARADYWAVDAEQDGELYVRRHAGGGSYVDVRITQVFPSSLVGEAVSAPIGGLRLRLLAQQALNATGPSARLTRVGA